MINLQKIQKPRREGREEKTKHKRELLAIPSWEVAP
jgi:hypothetical protein